jgi:hypothetical protein
VDVVVWRVGRGKSRFTLAAHQSIQIQNLLGVISKEVSNVETM